jgi:hypothetical protein
MIEYLSVCGVDCGTCSFLNNGCGSCKGIEGKTFWAIEHFGGICPIYDCSVNKFKFSFCGECSELPCKLYFDIKDPNLSEEQHLQSINKRVNNLINI